MFREDIELLISGNIHANYADWNDGVDISSIAGLEITEIIGLEKKSERVALIMSDGRVFVMLHFQDCCESVWLEDFESDIQSFPAKIISATEEENSENQLDDYDESFTWTFYKIETDRGGLWLRWYGSSNGYYSESVDFVELKTE